MHNTNLAVVAPGIAEALFATAIGLVAAIPGRAGLQQDQHRSGPLRRPAGRLRHRVRRHPVAPERGARLTWPGGLNGGSNGSRGRCGGRGDRYRPLAEINVTPLVDVMLVLLIIFMVTAPLMSSARQRRSAEGRDQPGQSGQRAAHRLDRCAGPGLSCRTRRSICRIWSASCRRCRRTTRIAASSCAATRRIPYGRIIEVMGTIVQGGFTKAALMSEAPAGVAPTSAPLPLPPRRHRPRRSPSRAAAEPGVR